MYQTKVKILENAKICGNYFKLSFNSPLIAKEIRPGQFMQIKVNDGIMPLLRKPFGIHRVIGKKIEILYEVVGDGTRQLSKKKPGGLLDIIAPLGNGFDLNPRTRKPNNPITILIAGGVGAAPLIFLAEKLTELKTQNSPSSRGHFLKGELGSEGKLKTIVLVGARTKNQILCEKEFKKIGCEVKIATDDGSKGFKGKVTKLLEKVLPNNPITQKPNNLIFACGPRPMLKEIARIAKAKGIPCQVLLEEYMACGIGVCLGCAVKTKDGYKMVCKDGPVFNADEVIWG